MPTTLSRQLFLVWVLVLASCLGIAGLLFAAWHQTGTAQLTHAQRTLATTCAAIVSRYNGASTAAREDSQAGGLADVVVQLVLDEAEGIEGGIWDNRQGFVAYAYPTYQGSGSKTDVPDAERSNLAATAAAALKRGAMADYTRSSERESLLIAACPIDAHRAGWTMTHVATAPGRSSTLFAAGAAVLLALTVTSAAALAAIMRRWSRRLVLIERSLAGSEAIPDLPPTGSPELDRLAQAVVDYATRLAASHQAAAALKAAAHRHERLATLGRMTATVAHEIRNPIATLRLAAENALALQGDAAPAAARSSLTLMLAQVSKLDELVESLLGMVQPVRVRLKVVDVASWAREVVNALGDDATAITLHIDAGVSSWSMDPAQVERACVNLLRNALQHREAGTKIPWAIHIGADRLIMAVSNQGSAISPAVADRLFEPFVTDRVDGNGLGLALVREIVEAHGGTARHERGDAVTSFIVELPWR
ncbi:MAG TPA: ATP-binding protein [Luteibacter sp.]|uniref:sensor histidine kinase n=1 Tax=Luteibacter sp. TaxID=1886636 RepID=UPI002C8EA58A|nr:ATP-binding protein [Luteibacter sp.]HVI55710.1 ATP-binding protein [Luteibacter sp.]